GPTVSMEEIANHAGTSKSVFYRYFEDKKGLQQAVAQASIDFMENELKKAGKAADSAQDGLYTMVLSYLRLADSSPNVYNFSTAIPTGMAIFTVNMARFLQRTVERALPQYQNEPNGTHLAYYWSTAAVGFVRAAGEGYIAEQSGRDLLIGEILARSIADWLLVGIDTSSRIIESHLEHSCRQHIRIYGSNLMKCKSYYSALGLKTGGKSARCWKSASF